MITKNSPLERKPYLLDLAVRGAHTICNKLFLFEVIGMKESEIRTFLRNNDVLDSELQDTYIEFVNMYRIVSH